MSKFNGKKPTTKTTNLAGGVAYKHSPEMELVSAVLTSFLEDKYYESGSDRIDRIKGLVAVCDDEFVAKLAVVARNEFNLRSVSHLLIAELSRKHRGDGLVSKAMDKAIVRPDDMTEIVSILGKKIPKQIKKGIRHAIYRFSPYQLAKYKMEGKKVKLVDLFNLAHPDPKLVSEDKFKAWAELMTGKLKNTETWEARLSSGENKETVWGDLISGGKLGYMALLRNLRNISTQADPSTISRACVQISNPEMVKKSRQLPFRFYNAYEQVDNKAILTAISIAMDAAVSNVPDFDGKTLVAVDVSGSMSGDCIKKASVLAAALVKKGDTDLMLYDTSVREVKFIDSEPTITLAEKIQRMATGGGTNTSLVFDYADGKGYDRIIILSDNESWCEGWRLSSVGTNTAYNEFKKRNNPFVYAIDIQGYGTKDVVGEKVKHICGFSEKIFDLMKWTEKGDIVSYVNSIEL